MIDLQEILRGIQNSVLDWIERATPDGCRVIRTATQAVDSGTVTPLNFDLEISDTDNCWSGSDPTKLFAARDGYYLAGGGWSMSAANNSAASRCLASVRLNGTTDLMHSELHTIAGKAFSLGVSSGMFRMSVGDYVEITMYHDEGTTKTLSAATLTNHSTAVGWLVKL